MGLYDSPPMGRPKSAYKDLPQHMTARTLVSGRVLFYYQAAGKKIPLGDNRDAALQEWAKLEAGGGSKKFPAIATIYLRETLPGLALGTQVHYRAAIANLSVAFAEFTLEQIEPRHIKAYMRLRSAKGAAMFERRVMSAFFNWARSEGHTKAPNPCRDMKFTKAERAQFKYTGKRDRYVTDDEYRALWSQGDAILQDGMDLAYRTGQRVGDVLAMTRQDIRDGELWIVQEKTKAKVGIRMEGLLKALVERILARSRPVPSMYLICDRRGQRVRYKAFNDRFVAARKASGQDWQFRDIRAKTATDLPEIRHAQGLLGHKYETTTAGYRRPKGVAVPPNDRSI